MKIIYRGVDPAKTNVETFQLQCGNCTTIVEVSESDLEVDRPLSRYEVTKSCKCPVCYKPIVKSEVTSITSKQEEPKTFEMSNGMVLTPRKGCTVVAKFTAEGTTYENVYDDPNAEEKPVWRDGW